MSWELAGALAEVGRAVRRAVGTPLGATDAEVVRTEGGDDVFGVDARADEALLDALAGRCAERWPGTIVLEGFDEPVAVGDPGGPWRYLADPVDGSRPWLWGKRSAWVLLGAGREATSLADLEVGACVELPTWPGGDAVTAWASRGGGARAVIDPVGAAVALGPLTGPELDRRFVSVMRYAIGTKAAVGAWEDAVLAGLETWEDPFICTGGLLMEVAMGRQVAVLDPRPWVVPESMASHPYDLAAWLVASEAGAIVEDLDGGALDAPLDTSTKVAWAAYANEAVATELRRRVAAYGSSPSQPGARSTR